MAEVPLFFILDSKILPPANSALRWLGRIVKNYKEPDSAFAPDDPSPYVQDKVSATVINNAVVQVKAHQSSSLAAALTRIASVSGSTQGQRQIDFAASSIVSVRLQQHSKVFRALRQDEGVRNELKELLPPMGKPAYMIVALLIWTDAAFVEQMSSGASKSGNIQFPLMSILAAAGASLPIDVGDPHLKAATSAGGSVTGAGFSKGSSIFAFEYKTIRRRVYSIMADFTPRMQDYGPRAQGDLVFSGSKEEEEAKAEEEKKLKDQAITFEMDEDHIVWTESIEENTPTEVETDEIAFAFH